MNPFKPLNISKTGLEEETINKIYSCLKKFSQIEKVVLYGSRAKGNYRKGSDIDLSLIGEGLDTNAILKLDNCLDDLLLPYTFDISIYDKLDNPKFKEHIDRVGILFFEAG